MIIYNDNNQSTHTMFVTLLFYFYLYIKKKQFLFMRGVIFTQKDSAKADVGAK